jgi:hypothetical protein
MKNSALVLACLTSILGAACGFQNTTELKLPTTPSSTGSTGSSSSAPSSSSSSSAPGTGVAALAGVWSSGSIAGLPDIATCGGLQWLITSQSATGIAGTISAVCGGSTTLTANLTGTAGANDTINLTANGKAAAMGVTCDFALTGTARQQTADTVRLDYQGTTCLGPVSGSETLNRKLPDLP